MQKFDVIVIGGGITGAGITRDSAMRGFKTLLLEKGDLGSGTSGKYHGLLHSGGRYVVDDPDAAVECIQENTILKKIAAPSIEDTGGLFLSTHEDDPDYAEQFLKACTKTGIPVEEISVAKALEQEPLLSSGIQGVFTVPDAACDSQKLIRMNIASAKEYGAKILIHHQLVGFEMTQNRINAVIVLNLKTNEKQTIECNFVINAAGIFAGNIAKMANISFSLVANKGSMLVMKKRFGKPVLNRCRKPGDGDILVQTGTTSIIGTTSVIVDDPNDLTIHDWEKRLLLEEGGKMIKDFSSYGVLYAYAGIRPLFDDKSNNQDGRSISRSFVLKNHKTEDNIDNLLSIFGGKLTTYRLMAEKTIDTMCENLNLKRACKTARELLPAAE